VNVVLLDAVRYTEWGRRAPSDDLPEHRGEVWELVAIRQRWQAVVTSNRIDLGLAFALHLGVRSHSKEEGGHGRDGLQGRSKTRAQYADFSRDSLTVSAPPEYRLDAAHLISFSSSGDTLRPSSKFVTKLGTAVPLAYNFFRNSRLSIDALRRTI
jgi:hypothetical protein